MEAPNAARVSHKRTALVEALPVHQLQTDVFILEFARLGDGPRNPSLLHILEHLPNREEDPAVHSVVCGCEFCRELGVCTFGISRKKVSIF